MTNKKLLDEWRASRLRIKSAIVKFSKFINDTATIARPLTRLIVIKIEDKLNLAIPRYDEFVAMHFKICDHLKTEDEDELTDFEEIYFESVAHAKCLLEEYETSNRPAQQAHGPPSNESTNLLTSSLTENKIKLPTIQLPLFNGKADQWLEFRDIFQTLIHNDHTLSNVKKLYYLKSALQGDAKELIQGLEISDDNYNVAWECLCSRFENKRLLIQNHLGAIHNLPTIVKESAALLRDILDKLNRHIRALKSLGEPVEHWDTVLIYVICSKLDSTSLRDWEEHQVANVVPKLDNLCKFLNERASTLDSLAFKSTQSAETKTKINIRVNKSFAVSEIKCYFCKGDHAIYYCSKFQNLSVNERSKEANRLRLCRNCLRTGHGTYQCEKAGCKSCGLKHNSLLHFKSAKNTSVSKVEPKSESMVANNDRPAEQNTLSCHSSDKNNGYVLLSTASVELATGNGQHLTCRALLDSGSQSNFITEKLAMSLGLKLRQINRQVSGISNSTTSIKGQCLVNISSLNGQYHEQIHCLLLPEISNTLLPQYKIDKSLIKIPTGIALADPGFNEPGDIDILLGAEVFWKIVKGPITLQKGSPALVDTLLGVIVSGTVNFEALTPSKCYFHQDALQNTLLKFWEIENFPTEERLSDEELLCEEHFLNFFTREPSGRFMVGIPFKESLDKLGVSKPGAQKRFMSLERRLTNNKDIKMRYVDFMNEYLAIGHMSLVENNTFPKSMYFLPHHCVINENSTSTKLRVVFDGSFITDSGFSRKHLEAVGPTIQSDLMSILLRFRTYKIAISADIEKMYRQVLIRPSDRPLQAILWRNNESHPLNEYQLNTVTYGTASAAFLATRCLHQLSIECEITDPHAALVISKDFYVDDLLTGVDTKEEAIRLCQTLKSILDSGCFPLRKWTSNVPSVLPETSDSSNSIVNLNSEESIKTLGLHWLPSDDCLSYSIGKWPENTPITKRAILSDISQIFDPLGIVGACVISAKIMLQELWKIKLDWDDPVPVDVCLQWKKFRSELAYLNNLRIPRCVVDSGDVKLQIQGFADASEKAYAACIYIRSGSQSGNINVHLLCAKSKVAPLKSLTIPRLELCAALLLARLIKKVIDSLRISIDKVYLWSDSTIVLAWLKKPLNLLKVFVSHRVAEINELTNKYVWNHIPTDDNPADLISRGVQASELISSSLWWKGPKWLTLDATSWPVGSSLQIPDLPEMRNNVVCTAILAKKYRELVDISRFSKFSRLIRALGYLVRFINCCKEKARKGSALTTNEIAEATMIAIKQVQNEAFSTEMHALQSKKSVGKASKVLTLNPYLDENGILRVGGRLQNSLLEAEAIHPIILPSNSHFTYLLIRHEHIRLGHAGPQLMLASIRNKYWPLHAKALVKRILHECVVCYKVKPRNQVPLMGNLPADRVRASRPFQVTGIDYAGPFQIKDRKGRGSKTSKCYIALFICFSTKAIHLEVVSSLCTESFIAAFRRFASRRGSPKAIWSDNGSNFVGANNELGRIIRSLDKDTVKNTFSITGINWHFIPANSPHFGGLWESGVRGTKFHLKRIMANASLTFEEFSTICCQVESYLNSRPLTPISDDPNDLSALTPGHFLIGCQLTGLPDEDLSQEKIGRLNRYQLLQSLCQQFWRRWSSEYLHTLQTRCKGKTRCSQLKVGQLVLIQDDNRGPLQWPLARITQVHPGKDGVVRVATLRTAKGVYQRAATKLFPLPMDGDDSTPEDNHNN